ncbi:DUF6009 family protein [Streptomyces sp. NPDC090093]
MGRRKPAGDYAVGTPGEAINPQTITPGNAGAKTLRSQKSNAANIVTAAP